ncbi:MAG: Rqc2 family fibronectin-binding protein [bacterium]
MDVFAIAAVVEELKGGIVGSRINRIHQPKPLDIILQFPSKLALVISAHPQWARLHLTSRTWTNPPTPSNFCLLLRKYLERGRVLDVVQVPGERVVHLFLESNSALRNEIPLKLIVEIMGRHSNIILVDSGSKILDSIKRVPASVNRYREVLPQRDYIPPPPQNKLDLLSIDKEGFLRAVGDPENLNSGGSLTRAFAPMSPAVERRLLDGFDGNLDVLWSRVEELVSEIKSGDWCAILGYPQGSASAFLDDLYDEQIRAETLSSAKGSLIRLLKDRLARKRREMDILRKGIEEAGEAEEWRIKGEILSSNLHLVKKGDASICAINYYTGSPVEIPLNPRKKPSDNVQAYYRRYRKLRNRGEVYRSRLGDALEEERYLDGLIFSVEGAESLEELEEIREEMRRAGYIRKKGAAARKSKSPLPPLSYLSSGGFRISVGRNNIQNDLLTLRTAGGEDLWFHTKEIPGAHVILHNPEGRDVPDRVLEEAAMVAAYHSKARRSSNVPVDYTLCKYVRKPKGTRPGMVIYTHQKTIYVTPDEDAVSSMRLDSRSETADR